MVLDDIIFDKQFSWASATTWQQHHDSLALQPVHSFIPDVEASDDEDDNDDDDPAIPPPILTETHVEPTTDTPLIIDDAANLR